MSDRKIEVTTKRDQDQVDRFGLECERLENAIAKAERKRMIVQQDVDDLDSSIAGFRVDLKGARENLSLALRGEYVEPMVDNGEAAGATEAKATEEVSEGQNHVNGARGDPEAIGDHVDNGDNRVDAGFLDSSVDGVAGDRPQW